MRVDGHTLRIGGDDPSRGVYVSATTSPASSSPSAASSRPPISIRACGSRCALTLRRSRRGRAHRLRRLDARARRRLARHAAGRHPRRRRQGRRARAVARCARAPIADDPTPRRRVAATATPLALDGAAQARIAVRRAHGPRRSRRRRALCFRTSDFNLLFAPPTTFYERRLFPLRLDDVVAVDVGPLQLRREVGRLAHRRAARRRRAPSTTPCAPSSSRSSPPRRAASPPSPPRRRRHPRPPRHARRRHRRRRRRRPRPPRRRDGHARARRAARSHFVLARAAAAYIGRGGAHGRAATAASKSTTRCSPVRLRPDFYATLPDRRCPEWAVHRDFELADRHPQQVQGAHRPRRRRAHQVPLLHLLPLAGARANGATDEELKEACFMGGMTVQYSNAITGMRYDLEKFQREVDRAVDYMTSQAMTHHPTV